MKKIVLSGATGGIGYAIIKDALRQNMEILCIARKDSGRLGNIPKNKNVKVVHAGLRDYDRLEIQSKYDMFFHLAWDKTFGASRDDVDIQILNIQYTLDAVRLAKRLGCTSFIGAGSQAEYGPVQTSLKPDTPCFPESGYGIAKYAAGKLSRLLCAQLGIRHNWIRIVSTFGPLDASYTLIMYAINELRLGRVPEFTKCEQLWDYLYTEDAGRAFIAVGDQGVDGKTYPLGSGKPRKLSEYLEALRDIVRPGTQMQFGKKEYYPHQPMYLCADVTELTADTGWKPEVAFEEGIKRIVANGKC